MKQTFKSLVAVVALLSTAVSSAVPYIAARSDSVNAARDMVGWEEFIHLCDMESTYGAFSVTPEFKQTFNPYKITNCLFGTGNDDCNTNCNTNCNTSCASDCGPVIKVQGSQVANRDATAWLGDYFGLPTDYSSEITFCPRVRTGLIDLSLYLGLDELANGLYFRIHAPIVWSRWSLNFNETIKAKGTNVYAPGYFSDVEIPRASMTTSAAAFFSGNSIATLAGDDETSATAAKFQALKCSRWSANGCDCSGLSLTRLSDIEAALGWNFYCDEDYAVGLSIRASAPTGNKVNECYLFAPVIGQGGSWKLGGGLDAHAIFWRSDDENSSFGLYLEANVQHIFKACQTRCFDLCVADGAGVNSRYMLAQRLGENTTLKGNATASTANPPTSVTSPDNAVSAYTASTLQFANEFAPVANLTTTKVNVDAAVEGDVALKFAYTHGGFTFDLGYEFWGRSCERFCKGANCNTTTLANWALKGDASVYGFQSPSGVQTTAFALAGTQTLTADITGGNSGINTTGQFNNTNTTLTGAGNPNGLNTNAGIDTPAFAYAGATTAQGVPLSAGGNPNVMTRTSIQPRVLAETDVNYASTKGISNKLFAHFGYAWNEREDWMPFLGIGGEVEWSGGNCNTNCGTNCNTSNCNTNCNTNCSTSCGTANLQGSCQTCAFSQWGVWAKLGIAFN